MGTWWKTALFAYLFFSFAAGFTGLFWLLDADPGKGPPSCTSPVGVYLRYAFAGGIGGTLYALRMYHKYYESLTPRFAFWYVMRPFLTAGTAVMTIILFESGILLLQVNDSLYAKVGLSFLAGFGYGKFMEKITLMTEALFNGKDHDDPRQPPKD